MGIRVYPSPFRPGKPSPGHIISYNLTMCHPADCGYRTSTFIIYRIYKITNGADSSWRATSYNDTHRRNRQYGKWINTQPPLHFREGKSNRLNTATPDNGLSGGR